MKKTFIILIFAAQLFTLFQAGYAQQKIKVACVGNSITEGLALKENEKYPSILQQLLGAAYEVRNYGISGRTLLKKGDRPYWQETRYKEVLDWEPDIVIIKLGTNDSKPQNWKFRDDFLKDYKEFVASFKNLNSHPRIWVCYPIPVFQDKWGITDQVVKTEIIPLVKKAAKKTHSRRIDLYQPFIGKGNLTYDGVHPNAEGDKLLATEVYMALKKRL